MRIIKIKIGTIKHNKILKYHAKKSIIREVDFNGKRITNYL